MDLKSPAVGRVIRLTLNPGSSLRRGDEVMVVESMKVEIPIKAPTDGHLKEVRVKVGDQIQRNAVLAVIET